MPGTTSDEQRLIGCFRRVFPTLSESVIPDANMRNVGAWDSAALLRLIAEVEKQFDVRFSAQQLNQFASFTSILELLRSVRRTPPQG